MWLSAITPNNISAGFRKLDIFPFNENSILTLESSKTPTTDVLSAPDTTLTAHTMPDTDTMGTEQILCLPWKHTWMKSMKKIFKITVKLCR